MTQKAVTGQIMTTRSGLGFVSIDTQKEDIRVEHEDLHTALNGDTVEIQRYGKGKRKAKVVRILQRAKTYFVGVLDHEDEFCFFVPDDQRMYVDILIPHPPKEIQGGEKVIVKLTHWDDANKDPIGEVVEILGQAGQHEVEIQSIVRDRGIDTTFPKNVVREAQQLEQVWNKEHDTRIKQAISDKRRRDFRDVVTMTIDPHDAKDFDDALSVHRTENGLYEIGIHIADVSHFVKPGSALDEEAKKRGFSTYLVDRTIPMLPEALSNDLCSLNEHVDRLTFSAVFTLDDDAQIQSRWFGKSVIHSDKRFSYAEAQEVLNKHSGPCIDELSILAGLAKILRARRIKAGSLDFAQEEVEIELDAHNVPTRIYRKEMMDTNHLIEDFMLLANREVARYIFHTHKNTKMPKAFLYRVHDLPDSEKIQHINSLLQALGYPAIGSHGRGRQRKTKISPQDINKVFKEVEGTPIEHMIKTALIRAMAKAVYATKNTGHFGLGFSYYTHFTSPIRRYSDLLVHRLVQRHLDGSEVTAKEAREHTQLAWELSQKEAAIQEAERESIKYKQVEYWHARIGSTAQGTISGVTDWGFFVEENKTGAEGLVRVSALKDDYYVYDEKRYQLKGKRSKKVYALGDTVTIKIVGADVERRTIDLEVVQ